MTVALEWIITVHSFRWNCMGTALVLFSVLQLICVYEKTLRPKVMGLWQNHST